MPSHPRKPRRTPGRRRAKECANCRNAEAIFRLHETRAQKAEAAAKQANSVSYERLQTIGNLRAANDKLTAERDEARASLERVTGDLTAAEQNLEEALGRVNEWIERWDKDTFKHAQMIGRLQDANAKLTEDCFRIRKSRDEAEARVGEMAKERDGATKKGCEVAFENGQLKERNAALREEIALLRANARNHA